MENRRDHANVADACRYPLPPWSTSDLNRPPRPCKSRALPDELVPHRPGYASPQHYRLPLAVGRGIEPRPSRTDYLDTVPPPCAGSSLCRITSTLRCGPQQRGLSGLGPGPYALPQLCHRWVPENRKPAYRIPVTGSQVTSWCRGSTSLPPPALPSGTGSTTGSRSRSRRARRDRRVADRLCVS